MSESSAASRVDNGPSSVAVWNILALGVATVAAAGSVYLSVGLGLKACPLCFYQRSFAIAAVLVLAMQFCLEGIRSARASLLVLPFALSGLGVAMFHVYLVVQGKLECPPALFGWGDGPKQSLAVFGALTVTALAGACSSGGNDGARTRLATMGTVVLAAGAAWACIASAPPLPPTPKQPYDSVKQPFDMCRPPFPGR